ncbi:hypothetical protein BESB_014230 [Besnoitia besnoiti]|uniref:Uncharacterized protein n=1 Tax=Besnoitia besnoiti TaxID=94643 RepID=A0A2A9MBP0_BESBE|nr:hypothetical protein BESB_014230 [Besnoitia besnoiti]PFH32810.1 hypothetical protein BESB_014230 [Besnoitia besnoiti]
MEADYSAYGGSAARQPSTISRASLCNRGEQTAPPGTCPISFAFLDKAAEVFSWGLEAVMSCWEPALFSPYEKAVGGVDGPKSTGVVDEHEIKVNMEDVERKTAVGPGSHRATHGQRPPNDCSLDMTNRGSALYVSTCARGYARTQVDQALHHGIYVVGNECDDDTPRSQMQCHDAKYSRQDRYEDHYDSSPSSSVVEEDLSTHVPPSPLYGEYGLDGDSGDEMASSQMQCHDAKYSRQDRYEDHYDSSPSSSVVEEDLSTHVPPSPRHRGPVVDNGSDDERGSPRVVCVVEGETSSSYSRQLLEEGFVQVDECSVLLPPLPRRGYLPSIPEECEVCLPFPASARTGSCSDDQNLYQKDQGGVDGVVAVDGVSEDEGGAPPAGLATPQHASLSSARLRCSHVDASPVSSSAVGSAPSQTDQGWIDGERVLYEVSNDDDEGCSPRKVARPGEAGHHGVPQERGMNACGGDLQSCTALPLDAGHSAPGDCRPSGAAREAASHSFATSQAQQQAKSDGLGTGTEDAEDVVSCEEHRVVPATLAPGKTLVFSISRQYPDGDGPATRTSSIDVLLLPPDRAGEPLALPDENVASRASRLSTGNQFCTADETQSTDIDSDDGAYPDQEEHVRNATSKAAQQEVATSRPSGKLNPTLPLDRLEEDAEVAEEFSGIFPGFPRERVFRGLPKHGEDAAPDPSSVPGNQSYGQNQQSTHGYETSSDKDHSTRQNHSDDKPNAGRRDDSSPWIRVIFIQVSLFRTVYEFGTLSYSTRQENFLFIQISDAA